jgi:hypothetical protein
MIAASHRQRPIFQADIFKTLVAGGSARRSTSPLIIERNGMEETGPRQTRVNIYQHSHS